MALEGSRSKNYCSNFKSRKVWVCFWCQIFGIRGFFILFFYYSINEVNSSNMKDKGLYPSFLFINCLPITKTKWLMSMSHFSTKKKKKRLMSFYYRTFTVSWFIMPVFGKMWALLFVLAYIVSVKMFNWLYIFSLIGVSFKKFRLLMLLFIFFSTWSWIWWRHEKEWTS